MSYEDEGATSENDISLECVDCKEQFTFTAGEQEFYARKRFTAPKRCGSCRTKKRERNAQAENNRGRGDYGYGGN